MASFPPKTLTWSILYSLPFGTHEKSLNIYTPLNSLPAQSADPEQAAPNKDKVSGGHL